MHHPEVQDRVRREISDVVGDEREEDITADHLKELKYTDRVILECMRKYFTMGIIIIDIQYPSFFDLL